MDIFLVWEEHQNTWEEASTAHCGNQAEGEDIPSSQSLLTQNFDP